MLRGGAQGYRDPRVLGWAACTAAPHLVFTYWVWFSQFQLDLKRGWRVKIKMMSMCIGWSFTAGSALGLMTSTLHMPEGNTPGALWGRYSIAACTDHPTCDSKGRGSRKGHRAGLGLARRRSRTLAGSRAHWRGSAIEQRKLW